MGRAQQKLCRMLNMKLADYVIEYLIELGVKQVFLVYGAAIGDLVDYFTKTDRIKYLCVMHEQAGAFAAETLTKVSGELGVTMVTSGPGGTNLLTGIANCWYDSIPNLYITGQIHSQFLRKDPSIRQVGFQENDIVSMAEPITKFATMVTDPNKIKWALDKAVYEATAAEATESGGGDEGGREERDQETAGHSVSVL